EDLSGRVAEVELVGRARRHAHDQQVVLSCKDLPQGSLAPGAGGTDPAADGDAVATAQLDDFVDGRLRRVARGDRAAKALTPGEGRAPAGGDIQRGYRAT